MSNLIRLLGRRLIAMPIMVLGVTLLVFIVMSFSSADPARLALGESASLQALENYREAQGLNDPMFVRFFRYLGGLVQFDLGESFTGVPISEMVAENFPKTLQLTFIGLAIAVVLALVLGVIAALYRDRWPDQLIRVISIASLATPSFWLALLMIQAFGNIISSTDTFRDWVGTDVPAGLRARLGWGPERRVAVLNDVDAHAVGEFHHGAAREVESLLMVAVGTGVGGALVLDGQLRTGARSVAGEIGHIPTPGADNLRCPCGRLGHLEAIAAGPAIERQYAALGGGEASGREVMERAAHHDDDALDVVKRAAVALGKAIAGVVTTLDPAAVVIGGGVAEAGPVWWLPLRETIRNEVVSVLADVPVLKAQLGNSAALVGAAAHVLASEEVS